MTTIHEIAPDISASKTPNGSRIGFVLTLRERLCLRCTTSLWPLPLEPKSTPPSALSFCEQNNKKVQSNDS